MTRAELDKVRKFCKSECEEGIPTQPRLVAKPFEHDVGMMSYSPA